MFIVLLSKQYLRDNSKKKKTLKSGAFNYAIMKKSLAGLVLSLACGIGCGNSNVIKYPVTINGNTGEYGVRPQDNVCGLYLFNFEDRAVIQGMGSKIYIIDDNCDNYTDAAGTLPPHSKRYTFSELSNNGLLDNCNSLLYQASFQVNSEAYK